MANKTRKDILEDIRLQMVDYVQLRQRLGTPITYQSALLSHREQCLQNLRDEPMGVWRERVPYLDELCLEEGL